MTVIAKTTRPCTGEIVCGDQITVVATAHATLVALADGLGHGVDAARASVEFCQFVTANSELPLDKLLWGAHKHIAGTRGVVAAILRICQDGKVAFAGVGNAELHSCGRRPFRPLLVRGVVGVRLTKVSVFDGELSPGDLLVMHSDGISTRFDLASYAHLSPEQIVGAILAEHGKAHDDAACVVIRYA